MYVIRLLLKPRAFVSQIVIDFVASQPNTSGELGAVAHPLVDTGEETWGTAVRPFTYRHLREEVHQLSTLGGRGITIALSR